MTNKIEKAHENGKHELRLIIDGKHHEWNEQYITGVQVRKLGW